MANLLKTVLEGVLPLHQQSHTPLSLMTTNTPTPNTATSPKSSPVFDNAQLQDPSIQKILPLIEASQKSEESMTELIEALKELDPAHLLPLLDFFDSLQQKGFLNQEFMPKLLSSKLEQIEQQFFTNTVRNQVAKPESDAVSPVTTKDMQCSFPSPSASVAMTLPQQENGFFTSIGREEPKVEGMKMSPQDIPMSPSEENPWSKRPSMSSQIEMTLNNENKLRMAMGLEPTIPKRSRFQDPLSSAYLCHDDLGSPTSVAKMRREFHANVPPDILSLHPTSQTSRSGSPQSSIADMEDHRGFGKDNLVTSSGRNRGLGRANEPKYCCQVCGDVAAGFHCGAYVCEACKKFYLRCLKNGQSLGYACPKTQNCEISKETRSHCQFCRYQKCVRLGMYKPGRDDSKHLRVDFKSIPCKVCGACSSGFHFGAITCEGCKGFFRRMVKEQLYKKFVCATGGSCEVASDKRTSCKACRYNKCVAVGMALQGTRLGRQSNSVKRSTLIQYKDSHGMDVALYPKIANKPEESDLVIHKVQRLLSQGSDSQPQPLVSNVKQEAIDEKLGLPCYNDDSMLSPTFTNLTNAKDVSLTGELPWMDDLFQSPSLQQSQTSVDAKGLGSGWGGSPLSAGPVGRAPFFDSKEDNITTFGGKEQATTTQLPGSSADDVFRLPLPTRSFSLDASLPSTSSTAAGTGPPPESPSSLSMQSSPMTPKSLSGWPSLPEGPIPRARQPSRGSQPSPVSVISLPSPSAEQMFENRPNPVTMREALLRKSNSSQLVKSFLQKMSQHAVDTTFPNKPVSQLPRTRRLSGARAGPGDTPPNLTPEEMQKHDVGIKNIDEHYQDSSKVVAQVMKAYRELENIHMKPRENLNGEAKGFESEKMAAWFAAYESFMHLTKYTLKFVKKIPGFRDLLIEDQITLVRESVYPINLLYHSQFTHVYTKEKRWYCNTAEEKAIIIKHFPKFDLLQKHLEYVGELFTQLGPTLEEYAFLCAIVLFTIDSFLVKDYSLVDKIQHALTDAFLAYCTEVESDVNRPGTLLLRLAELRRANFEHTQIALDIQTENPDMQFSQLWREMFLSCLNSS